MKDIPKSRFIPTEDIGFKSGDGFNELGGTVPGIFNNVAKIGVGGTAIGDSGRSGSLEGGLPVHPGSLGASP
ncbi:hypothetical protein KY289_031482 [Solanum tuberosum]|nr:hypothetical protein KY289_031482 [Solanum tuberosum]